MERPEKHSFSCIPIELLINISEFFNDPKDFLNFTLISKYYFNHLILNNNYVTNLFFKRITFKNSVKITTSEIINNLPKYIKLNLKYLNCDIHKDLNFDSLLKIENLVLNANFLYDYNFDEKCLQNLTTLRKLSIFELANASGFTGKYLKNLTNLIKLSSINTDLNEKYLQNVKQLETLILSNCENVTGECLHIFQNLKTLIVDDIKIINCKELPNSLTYLKLDSSEASDNIIKNLINLKTLDLGREKKIIGNCLQNLNKLERLTISYCTNLKGKYLTSLDNNTLKILCLAGLKVKGKHLLHLTNLTGLRIDNIAKVNDNGLKHFINLECFFCSLNIDGSCLKYFTKLKKLWLINSFVKDEDLRECKDLEYFEIKNFSQLEGDFLNYLKNLRFITIGDYKMQQDETFNEFKSRVISDITDNNNLKDKKKKKQKVEIKNLICSKFKIQNSK
ncbi:hypothetical protein ABK040_000382 [Willaertia magna]